jgi:hypothetical protein
MPTVLLLFQDEPSLTRPRELSLACHAARSWKVLISDRADGSNAWWRLHMAKDATRGDFSAINR